MFGFAAAGAWMLRSDTSMKAAAKAPPTIPQKILDSIERKKPVLVDIAPAVRVPETIKPVLQEAPVSLTKQVLPQPAIREVSSRPQKPKKRHSASPAIALETPTTAGARVTIFRTDSY
jgi:hypothetical protein